MAHTRGGIVLGLALLLGTTVWHLQRDEPSRAEEIKPAEKIAAESAGKPIVGRAAIETALEQPAKIELLVDTSLADYIKLLREKHHLAIEFDIRSLQDAAIEPVQLILNYPRLGGVSLRSQLKLILGDYNLTTVVRHGVLMVMSKDAADATLETRQYDVRDLLDADPRKWDFDSLIEVITSSIDPTTWDEVGGPGSIHGFERGSLVFSQTEHCHREIAKFLAALRAARKSQAEGKIGGAFVAGERPADAKIAKLLDERVNWPREELSIAKFASRLATQLGISCQLDLNAFKDAELDPRQAEVTMIGPNIPLRDALALTLRDLDLTTFIADETLVISTRDKADATLTVRVYPIADLLQLDHLKDERELLYQLQLQTVLFNRNTGYLTEGDSIIELITSTIQPTTWDEVGGPGSIIGYDAGQPVLVVSQTDEVHHEIVELLAMLRAQPKPELKAVDDPAEREMTMEFYDLTPFDGGATGTTTKSSFQVGKVAGKNQPDEEKTIEDSPKQPALPPPLDGAEVIALLKELSPKDRWTEEGASLRSVGRYLVVRHYPQVHREVQLTMMKLGVPGNRGWWSMLHLGSGRVYGGGNFCGEHLKRGQENGGFSGGP